MASSILKNLCNIISIYFELYSVKKVKPLFFDQNNSVFLCKNIIETTKFCQTNCSHYENMPIQNILKILQPKKEKFQIKNSYIFHVSAQNIDCGYSLEPPRRDGSNEYPQSIFLAEIRKIMYTL